MPKADALFDAIKPVVIAIVVQALWRFARSAVRSKWLAFVAFCCLALNLVGVNELAVLGAGGCIALATRVHKLRRPSLGAFSGVFVPAFVPATPATIGFAPFALVFAKIGSVLFGSGYVLLAFLRADLVERLHWLTEKQLLDAIAAGQFTPGPVFTTATFVGYLLRGTTGAVAATLGIFLPAFLFVAITAPLMPKLRKSHIHPRRHKCRLLGSDGCCDLATW
jgi:chromate transporter